MYTALGEGGTPGWWPSYSPGGGRNSWLVALNTYVHTTLGEGGTPGWWPSYSPGGGRNSWLVALNTYVHTTLGEGGTPGWWPSIHMYIQPWGREELLAGGPQYKCTSLQRIFIERSPLSWRAFDWKLHQNRSNMPCATKIILTLQRLDVMLLLSRWQPPQTDCCKTVPTPW